MWNSLEIAKLVVSALTPLLVLVLTVVITRYTKEVERLREQSDKLGEKRMELYDRIGVKINEVFCYFWYVGKWKDMSPFDVLEKKRELDAVIHTYRPFFSDEFFALYRQFIQASFAEYAAMGEDAKLRTTLKDRAKRFRGEWKGEWDNMLTNEDNSRDIRGAYESLLARLASELDLASVLPSRMT